jgi:hypothetical protein
MDSARFIRRRSVLALWVIAPLAVMAGILAVSRGLLEREKIGLIQDRELSMLIPAMEETLAGFDRFISDYRLDAGTKLSMEDRHIVLLNSAAEQINFTITAINLEQDPPDKTPPGTVRISLFVKGSGSDSGIAAFLNNVKTRDKLLYEKRVQITPALSDRESAFLEAEFGRVYLATEDKNETSIQN